VTGAVPPLGEADWQGNREYKRANSQYERLNRGMSLDEFKTIYWWSGDTGCWRLIGRHSCCRFCGSCGAIIRPPDGFALAGIFALGAVQARSAGWMVASGHRAGERVAIPPRIPPHAGLHDLMWRSCGRLIARPRLTLSRLAGEGREGQPRGGPGIMVPRHLRWSAGALLVLSIVQNLSRRSGGRIGGRVDLNNLAIDRRQLIPRTADLFFATRCGGIFSRTPTVQFDTAWWPMELCALGSSMRSMPASRGANKRSRRAPASWRWRCSRSPASGIMTLIRGAPIELALLHQAVALVVLTATTLHARAP